MDKTTQDVSGLEEPLPEAAMAEFHSGLKSDRRNVSYDRQQDMMYVGVGPPKPCVSLELGNHLVVRLDAFGKINAVEFYEFKSLIDKMRTDDPEAAELFSDFIRRRRLLHRLFKGLDLAAVVELAYQNFVEALRGDFQQQKLGLT